MSEPKRCKHCREARKSDGGGVKGKGYRVEQAQREMDALFKPAKKASKKAKKSRDQ